MELSTIIGIIVGVVALLVGMTFKGVPLSALNNNAAIFVILVGTVGAVLNATPMSDISRVGKLFGKLVKGNKFPYSNVEVINVLTDLAQLARKEGALILESKLGEIKDPFLRRGLALITMGQNGDVIEDTMMEEIEAMEARHRGNATIFSQAGSYAPTLGVLGAVMGLIAAMNVLDNQDEMAHAIGAAFMATIYGIFTGYVLWNPFANKLKRLSSLEVLNKRIMVEGVLLIHEGMAPQFIKDKLTVFLSEAERVKFFPDDVKI